MASIKKILEVLCNRSIRAYQLLIAPILPASCRFYPSCSSYAQEAISHYGPLRGIWLSIKRILRCHPWADGGYDPVTPDNEKD